MKSCPPSVLTDTIVAIVNKEPDWRAEGNASSLAVVINWWAALSYRPLFGK